MRKILYSSLREGLLLFYAKYKRSSSSLVFLTFFARMIFAFSSSLLSTFLRRMICHTPHNNLQRACFHFKWRPSNLKTSEAFFRIRLLVIPLIFHNNLIITFLSFLFSGNNIFPLILMSNLLM